MSSRPDSEGQATGQARQARAANLSLEFVYCPGGGFEVRFGECPGRRTSFTVPCRFEVRFVSVLGVDRRQAASCLRSLSGQRLLLTLP